MAEELETGQGQGKESYRQGKCLGRRVRNRAGAGEGELVRDMAKAGAGHLDTGQIRGRRVIHRTGAEAGQLDIEQEPGRE